MINLFRVIISQIFGAQSINNWTAFAYSLRVATHICRRASALKYWLRNFGVVFRVREIVRQAQSCNLLKNSIESRLWTWSFSHRSDKSHILNKYKGSSFMIRIWSKNYRTPVSSASLKIKCILSSSSHFIRIDVTHFCSPIHSLRTTIGAWLNCPVFDAIFCA